MWKWTYSNNEKYTLTNKLYNAMGGAYHVNSRRYEDVFEVVRKSDRKKVIVRFEEIMPDSDERRPLCLLPNAAEIVKAKF